MRDARRYRGGRADPAIGLEGTLGRLPEAVELQLANGDVVRGEACWPVEIQIEGFRPISNEVIFLDAEDGDAEPAEPLLGYVILEQAQAAVDMLGHRLVPVKYIDMKVASASA